MPRQAKGPRLYLRQRAGRQAAWVILDDGGYEQGTGFGAGDRSGAEAVLARYLATKHVSTVGTHDPAVLAIADVMTFYATAKHPGPNPTKLRRSAYESCLICTDHIIAFFGVSPTKDIRGSTCRDYVRWRTHEGAVAPGWPDRRPRPVSDQTARRELVVLSAAVNLYHKEYGLDVLPVVTLPPIPPSRRRALTRSQAAQLLAGALGFYRDEEGRLRRRPRSTRTQRKRTARFILIGLYSGTRSGAIVAARWVLSMDAPWIDVDRGILHRRGDGEVETNKRRPPARIPPRLLAHLRRWRRMDMDGSGDPCTQVISRSGAAIETKIRKGWAGARIDAGLGSEVVPHVLRHTAGTWLAQGGVPTREAADYLGMSPEVFERTYYSAHPDFQQGIGAAFSAAKAAERNRTAPKHAQETASISRTNRDQME